MNIRDADSGRDGDACAAVYGPYVADSVASFELVPPSGEEMARRIEAAYVWLIAETDGRVAGYAYGSRHRDRAAYRWAADVAVYIDAQHHRAGVGRALYAQLIPRLRGLGLWTLCGGVTQPNEASDGLHAAMGFESVANFRRIGWKDGAWHDVRWWQLDLRPGVDGPPAEPSAS
jgi:L-amino acid N-acyltransferase YncA